jgi:capsular exopolysaccharide synthesis family protein
LKTEPERLDLERALTVLRHRWWVIGLVTVLVGGASFAFSKHQAEQYTATASVLFQNPQLSQQESGLPVTLLSPAEDPTIMATNVQLLTQQPGAAANTASIIAHGLTASAVSQAISVSQVGQTSVANVSATSTSPTLAAAIANTYVAQFISSQRTQQRASVQKALDVVQRQIALLSTEQLAGTNGQALVDRAESLQILARLQDGGAVVVARAKVPPAPSSPRVLRNTVLGLLLGLLIGVSLAFLLERFDRRIKTAEDLEAIYRLPLLAAVPDNESYATSSDAVLGGRNGEQEVFRLLRAYLRYFNVHREVRSLVVASAARRDGKTTVARNLAHAAQETGIKTLLIDADLRRPDLATSYGVSAAPGLSEVLAGRAQAPEAIRSIPIATRVNGKTAEVTLDVLVAGHPPPNPAELIESQAMAEILSWGTEHYELVVIDTAPLSIVSDAIPLLPKVDGVVIVGQIGKSTRDAAECLRGRLVGVNAPLLGVVANRVKDKGMAGYGYWYGYYGDDRHSKELEQHLAAVRRDEGPLARAKPTARPGTTGPRTPTPGEHRESRNA